MFRIMDLAPLPLQLILKLSVRENDITKMCLCLDINWNYGTNLELGYFLDHKMQVNPLSKVSS